jgi:hypothetical protein
MDRKLRFLHGGFLTFHERVLLLQCLFSSFLDIIRVILILFLICEYCDQLKHHWTYSSIFSTF